MGTCLPFLSSKINLDSFWLLLINLAVANLLVGVGEVLVLVVYWILRTVLACFAEPFLLGNRPLLFFCLVVIWENYLAIRSRLHSTSSWIARLLQRSTREQNWRLSKTFYMCHYVAYTLFSLIRTSKIELRLDVLIFSAISASKCSYFVLKILYSLMAPNVVIPYFTVLHCRDPDLQGA